MLAIKQACHLFDTDVDLTQVQPFETVENGAEKPEWADAAEKKKEFIKQQLEELNALKGTVTAHK